MQPKVSRRALRNSLGDAGMLSLGLILDPSSIMNPDAVHSYTETMLVFLSGNLGDFYILHSISKNK